MMNNGVLYEEYTAERKKIDQILSRGLRGTISFKSVNFLEPTDQLMVGQTQILQLIEEELRSLHKRLDNLEKEL